MKSTIMVTATDLDDEVDGLVESLNMKLHLKEIQTSTTELQPMSIPIMKTQMESIKVQRKTKNLGLNTSSSQDDSYAIIEAQTPTARCSDGNHVGERIIPVRQFYLNKGGKAVQGACIVCQKNRRANRILRCREKFSEKTSDEIYELYVKTYGSTKTCSACKNTIAANGFPISISMESGLHNMCKICSTGNSQGNGSLRDFIYMPDKDGVKYTKKEKCERCEGTDKLAVDHILPIAKGGTDCINNKQTLCIHCNSKKSDTIDCTIGIVQMCERYRDGMDGSAIDYTNYISLTQILSKKVYEFRKKNIDDASLEIIRQAVKEYKKKYNLGHSLDRIVGKIAILKGLRNGAGTDVDTTIST